MSETGIWGLVALGLACAAFGAFGLATSKHHRARFGRDPSAATVSKLRGSAWVLLALAALASVLAQGWVFGTVLWSGVTMLGAAAAFLLLNGKEMLLPRERA